MGALADLVREPPADVAVLDLEVATDISGGLRPDDFDRGRPAPGSRFLTYGFPKDYDTGTQASGEVLVAAPGGWLQVRDTQDRGHFIKPGFSGAPVFAEACRNSPFASACTRTRCATGSARGSSRLTMPGPCSSSSLSDWGLWDARYGLFE
jgi:hypothetical protein